MEEEIVKLKAALKELFFEVACHLRIPQILDWLVGIKGR